MRKVKGRLLIELTDMTLICSSKGKRIMRPNITCFIGGGSCNFQPSFRGGSLSLCQVEGEGRVLSNHQILKYTG